MMRNFIFTFLVLALLLPAFLPLAPHSAVHALYDAHTVHHVDSFDHNGAQFDNFHEHDNVNHNAPIDLASYYKDFLHIDLKNTDQNVLISTLISDQDFDYDIAVEIFTNSPYQVTSHQKRGPPSGYVFLQDFQSLYLTTLRLLI